MNVTFINNYIDNLCEDMLFSSYFLPTLKLQVFIIMAIIGTVYLGVLWSAFAVYLLAIKIGTAFFLVCVKYMPSLAAEIESALTYSLSSYYFLSATFQDACDGYITALNSHFAIFQAVALFVRECAALV